MRFIGAKSSPGLMLRGCGGGRQRVTAECVEDKVRKLGGEPFGLGGGAGEKEFILGLGIFRKVAV